MLGEWECFQGKKTLHQMSAWFQEELPSVCSCCLDEFNLRSFSPASHRRSGNQLSLRRGGCHNSRRKLALPAIRWEETSGHVELNYVLTRPRLPSPLDVLFTTEGEVWEPNTITRLFQSHTEKNERRRRNNLSLYMPRESPNKKLLLVNHFGNGRGAYVPVKPRKIELSIELKTQRGRGMAVCVWSQVWKKLI